MTDRTHQRSKLESKAERFFEHDSELSDSDESLERTYSNNQTKRNKLSQNNKDITLSARHSSRTSNTNDSTRIGNIDNTRRLKPRTRSSNKENESIYTQSPTAMDGPSNVASLKNNYTLRVKISDLSKTLSKKNKTIRKLYDNVYADEEKIKTLVHQVNELSEKNRTLEGVQEKLRTSQENELNLIQELTAQQKIARNALLKFQELQEQSLKEVANAKQYYREFYGKENEEIRRQLEQRIEMVIKDKDTMYSTLKAIETEKEAKRNSEIDSLNQEVAKLRDKLIQASAELESLQTENSVLKLRLKDQEELNKNEKNLHKSRIEALLNDQRKQEERESEQIAQEAEEKAQLYEKIESLESEIRLRDRTTESKEKQHKEQLEQINSKLEIFQKELRRIGEYEIKIETLEKELEVKEDEFELAKQYYREKLSDYKKSQNQQKNEWSTIYSEMLTEIKELKSEIKLLGEENTKLLASLARSPRSFK